MSGRIYRFTEFELIPAEGELRTSKESLRLQEKPLLLLCALLDQPQRLVTRDQLRERMWGGETFVDYEQGINVAIWKVRDALGDSAENPKFIETIPRRGYRFLLPVEVSEPVLIPTAVSALQPEADQEVRNYPEASTARSSPRPALRGTWLVAALVGILSAIGLNIFGVQKPPHSPRIRSLAVLPLQDLSPDPGQEYFADGITEEVITNLAQSLPLRVISRTSVMRYKDTKEPITEIARRLGVEAIVEGGVARSGNRVTVTVQLIDATEDRHLWAQKYDRNLEDLLNLEADLSQEIASQVGSTLTAHHIIEAAKARPVDPQVYRLCLLGRYHWNKRTAADLAKSAEYYQRAIDGDPTYAPAYAGLANAFALMPSYDSIGFRSSYAKATAAARRALELDDTVAQAHATLGFIGLNWMPDWGRAEPELRRALELNPNYATAHHWFSFYLLFVGQSSEALAELERARQLDPLSAIINADEGHFLYGERRYEEAKARLAQAIELEPGLGQPHLTLSLIALETGHVPDALKEARTALALDANDPRTLGEAGYVFAATGHAEEARKLLSRVEIMVRRGSGLPLFAALIHMGLGQRNEAIDALEEMANPEIAAGLQDLSHWHAFDDLRIDPRFQKLLAREKDMNTAQSLPH